MADSFSLTSAGGGASHSKVMMLSIPRDLSCSTVLARSLRCISGTTGQGRAGQGGQAGGVD
jgi:hypothetical protein